MAEALPLIRVPHIGQVSKAQQVHDAVKPDPRPKQIGNIPPFRRLSFGELNSLMKRG